MATRQVLRSQAVHRAAIAILAAVVALAVPEMLERLLGVFLGVVAVAVGVVEMASWWRTRRWRDLAQGLAIAIAGIILLFGGQQARRDVEIVVAVLVGLRGAIDLFHAYRAYRADRTDPFWGVARGLAMLLLAAILFFIPQTFFLAVTLAVVIGWIVAGAIVIVNTIGADEDTPVPEDVVAVIRERSMASQLRQQVTENIFEPFESHESGVAYAALMAFATAIATFGVKADSTAVVIGAMLIAPLMSPIMAVSASILMGWPHRVLLSARRVALGVAIGIGGSFLLSLISPEFVAITSNSEVLSRTSPTMLDLLIALAAGAAGGYAVTHPRVGNSLPGVAIAVALAPPLAVVGYSLEQLEFGFAFGAFLLFLTNLVGIVIAAGSTYVLSGYSPWTRVTQQDEESRRSLALIGLGLGLVAVPLGIIGQGIVHQTTSHTLASESVDDWLGDDSGYEMVSTSVTGEDVTVSLVGSGDLPDEDQLAQDLASQLGGDVVLTLDVTPQETTVVHANRSGVIESDTDDS